MSRAGSVLDHPLLSGVQSAGAALTQAADSSAWQLADDEVESGLATVLAVEAAAVALRGVLLREAEVRGLGARTAATSAEQWLGDRFRLSRSDAGARLRTARALGRHPKVESALLRGALTVEQAEVTAVTLDQLGLLPGLSREDESAATSFLLEQCAALGPRDLARTGRALVEALTMSPSVDGPAEEAALRRDEARAETEADRAGRNDLRVSRRHGRLRAHLDLGPVGEATLLAWLRRAESPHPGEDGFEDQRPVGERRADALVELVAAAACRDDFPSRTEDAGPDGPGPTTGPPVTVTVTVTLEELRAGLSRAGRLETGATLDAATLRRLACDAVVVPAVLGGASEVLDLGRGTRVWNRAQRRAAALRDAGCVAPGCDRPPSACQVHHAWHWSEGGPTDLANAALLCGFHHRMVHRQGWAVVLAASGFPQLVPAAAVDPQRRPRQHHRFRLRLLTGRHRR